MTVAASRVLALLAFAACWGARPDSCARAQTQLEWNAPADCPAEVEVAQAIARALDPAVAGNHQVEVEAEIERIAGGYALALNVRTQSGKSRERLEASDCALFVRIVALKVSLLATAPQRPAPVPAPVARSAAADSGSVWSLRAQAQLAAATVPAPAWGVGVGAGYRFGVVQLEALGSYLFPRGLEFSDQPGVGGTFQAWAAALRACAFSPWPAAQQLELAGCAGVEGGLMRGSGVGVNPAHVSDRAALSLSAGVSALLPFGRMFGLRADIDALFGLVRPDFYVRNLGVLHRAPAVGARGLLGIELRLP